MTYPNKQSTLLILMVLATLLLAGCSHRNLIKLGQQHIASGHIELAVNQFEQALIEKPNHQPTVDLLANANRQLGLWANQLESKADQAYNKGHNGKAMLLYSKVAQLNNSEHAIAQYKKIYLEIRQLSALKVTLLDNKVGITTNDLINISGLLLTNDDGSSKKLSFSQSNPVFEIQQSNKNTTTQFISGSQMITNPELLEIQHKIRHLQNQNHDLRDNLSESNRQLNQHNSELRRLNQQYQSTNQHLLRSDLDATAIQKYRHQLSQIQSKITQTQQHVSQSQQRSDKYRDHLSHDRNELSHLISQLAVTPAVISVPVYSDYHYPVQHQRNSLTAQLYLNYVNDKSTSTRIAQAAVVSQDDSHPAHPTIDLAADPMVVKTQQQLSHLLKAELKQIAKRLINELIDEQRHLFIRQANQSIDIEQKLALWIQHGMVSEDGALALIAEKIQQTLIIEYGVSGEFDVNRLLHRY